MCFETAHFADKIKWPVADFGIDAAHVFTENAGGHDVQGAEKENGHHERGVARNRVSEEYGMDDEPEGVGEGQQPKAHAEIGPDAERHGR